MGKFFLSFLLLCALLMKANAQQKFFIYVESETKEPFYLLIDGKTNFSSSLNGFLTIPQMSNGDYDAEIGFVKNKYPEQHFILSIKGMDVGFILRRAKDNTFSLLNLQTFATLMPVNLANNNAGNVQSSLLQQPISNTNTNLTNKLKQKPNCTIASDADYSLLKKQMQNAKTDLEMIAEAQTVFEDKCFSVEEIKNLGKLFSTDKNKLAFFLAAKEAIYDGNNFGSLQGQLIEPAIIKQFKNAL